MTLDGRVVGVGVDLVEVDRIGKALARTPGLADRLFSSGERAYCESARDPAQQARRFAARFAAKEAAMKALATPMTRAGFHDIEVVRDEHGVPSLRVSGQAGARAVEVGGQHWLVSLTHTETLAQATVLLTC